jgi:hypothetical protein
MGTRLPGGRGRAGTRMNLTIPPPRSARELNAHNYSRDASMARADGAAEGGPILDGVQHVYTELGELAWVAAGTSPFA